MCHMAEMHVEAGTKFEPVLMTELLRSVVETKSDLAI